MDQFAVPQAAVILEQAAVHDDRDNVGHELGSAEDVHDIDWSRNGDEISSRTPDGGDP